MRDGSEHIESLLLDWHLNRLEAEQARRVEEALVTSPELKAQSDALAEVLGLLDEIPAPEPPANLAESVLARIDEQTKVLPFKEPSSALPSGTSHDLSASPALSLRELIAIAACITLIAGILVPGYFKAQSIARRNLCRNNQRMIWQGMANYTEDNDGYLAYSGYVPGGSFLPTRATNVRRVSNTRPIFKLLRHGYLPKNDARVFLCPSAKNARSMHAEDYSKFTDFVEPANNSFSWMYMNLPKARHKSRIHLRMVLVGDRNPLFDPNAVGHSLSPYAQGNSLSHKISGQNVMYVSGQGGWVDTPRVGVDRDDIYRAGELARYLGTESPTTATDTWLVP
jgi:hypothetical protein